ncbi:TetR family transcriptional regulator [Roseobacter sp. HKCCD9010]|jgi:AcrR family transcriptional regulator|uniref:TetR/AcrR family transcriptional regulator n=1 Tax=unclassified Roseobacter TaxID=196798 RepID=UPI001198F94C|nr:MULTISPECIES: TetR/AcrR family transcriptional regulator [unclassified Roseobacter]MBF9049432.1 TetR family transcriptional regulator [Rhodobacterales bacterium HKCCD4356]NNV11432.1 TetR family transcriptional regulator [Roseobacter sp. HKCCD7357]NNV15616.1 TetR family transcriptional regulator [Roseobacter sp. HKCCD8768]NNV25076.1 TetR family transcriptional regulator [Roseobacter sp. HKCCD8192]NNV29333.1 TetR family transcriptional regulator [Roseobacter sp. HKCCD9061]
MPRSRPLHRNDPAKEPLVGNVKVTREDWLNVALDVLVSDGVEQVKVLALGDRLGVSRSSFYWYFSSRQDLLDALLKHWEDTNTAALVDLAGADAKTVTGAVCNVFRAVVNPQLFDVAFDFAVRDWARRSGAVRRVLDRSDAKRLDALTQMFARYDYPPLEALTRARTLYYMQIGYNDADLKEPVEDRLKLVPMYLYVFTGRQPQPDEIADFTTYAKSLG